MKSGKVRPRSPGTVTEGLREGANKGISEGSKEGLREGAISELQLRYGRNASNSMPPKKY